MSMIQDRKDKELENKTLRVLSLGAGVQSSTVALMIHHKELPMVDCAIFADTKNEPDYVYEWLEYLKGIVSYPVHIVTRGDLKEDMLSNKYSFLPIPLYTINKKTGKKGFTMRQCTNDYKIQPIYQKIRELLGLKKYQRVPKDAKVEMVIGISRDEMVRCKESRLPYITNHYPLVFDKRFNRSDCMQWMKKNGYALPRKSACTFCPFHSNDFWLDIKNNDPKMWKEVVDLDKTLRNATRKPEDEVFLHKSYVPLEEADLDPYKDQLDMFNDICDEGMCGV